MDLTGRHSVSSDPAREGDASRPSLSNSGGLMPHRVDVEAPESLLRAHPLPLLRPI